MGDPDAPPLDVEKLFAVLEAHRVEYVVIGGMAARLHGATRPTMDLDLCPEWDTPNLDRLADALRSVGARLRVDGMSEPVEFPLNSAALRQFEVSTWRTVHGDLDVVISTPTVSGGRSSFRDLAERAVRVDVPSVATIRVACLDDLLASKRRLRRPTDLDALAELEGLQSHTP